MKIPLLFPMTGSDSSDKDEACLYCRRNCTETKWILMMYHVSRVLDPVNSLFHCVQISCITSLSTAIVIIYMVLPLYQHVALAMILNIFGSDQLVWTPNCFNFATFSSMKSMTW
jgi:hypothetical protein